MATQKKPNSRLEAASAVRADSLLKIIRKAIFLIGLFWKNLSKRMFFSDFFSVAASIGFVIVPAFLMGFILLLLPQGRDTLLIIIEQIRSGGCSSLFGLLFSITLWSVFSELAVRYAISISDNSGLNLTDIRVLWRKTVQKLLAGMFLLWPGVLVLIGLLITMFTAEYIKWPERLLVIGLPIVLFIVLQWILCFLYFHKFEPIRPGMAKQTLLGHRGLPPEEQRWLNKLYGIYNDYVFRLPKPTNFKGNYKKLLQGFTDLYLKGNTEVVADEFPQDSEALSKHSVVPKEFILLNPGRLKDSSGIFKWIYCVPPLKVYPVFHSKVRRIALVSFGLLVLISIIPAEWPIYAAIGAPGLVCLAFACYTGIYAGLLYIDKVLMPRSPVSIRLVMLIWVLVVSFVNSDHPVRLHGKVETRPKLQAHFKRWFTEYKKNVDQRLGQPLKKYPVVFICAEGGAFRTAAYTALFLTMMESELAKRTPSVDFRHSIYAMSGVSGGAVGLGFYNAVAFRSGIPFKDAVTVENTSKFFLHDSLSPLIGKMFFSEFLNLFFWDQAELFDRAAALEKSWESAYQQFSGAGNTYREEFILPDTGRVKPLLLINTVEVETGLQCWMSNVQTDSLLFAPRRDLLLQKISNTRYSTAINFSSRFPLFSPAAEIDFGKSHRLHYLDGGYVENSGSATMLEVLAELRKTDAYQQIVPVIISLRFGEDSKDTSDIKFLNEINEIGQGLYNTRSGRVEVATYQLEKNAGQDRVFIKAPLSPAEKKIPMNWVLSGQSMNRIKSDIAKKLLPDSGVIEKFFRADLIYMPLKPIKK